MAKIKKLREILKLMVMKEVSSLGAGSLNTNAAEGDIKTPNAFTGGRKGLEKRRKNNAEVSGLKRVPLVRKNFVSERTLRHRLFEDVVNDVTFGMKLSDQAKELMDFTRGSQQHADELKQINDLLQGMGQAGEVDKQKAFELYQEFIQNAARDFVRTQAPDMKPEEYFLKRDLLQLTYYFTQKFETPMTQGPGAIDKEPGQEPQGQQPPQGGEDGGGQGGGGGQQGGGGGGGSAPSMGGGGVEGGNDFEIPPGEGEAGAEGEGGEGEGEAPPEGGEEENPEGGPPKPEQVAESKKKLKEDIGGTQLNDLEKARAEIIRLAKQYVKIGKKGIAQQLIKAANAIDDIQEGKKK